MIPLNSRQALPRKAFWYLFLRSLIVAMAFVLVAVLEQLAAGSPGVKCSGLLCGRTSGNAAPLILYLVAAVLILAPLLRYKAYSFVLTDRTLSIQSGVVSQGSTTFRLDRIQDVDLSRGPLLRWLGLQSVSIWTASVDQHAGRRSRPDGFMVLDVGTADWLKEFLTDPTVLRGETAAAAGNRAPPALGAGAAARLPSHAVLAVALILLALVFLGMGLNARRRSADSVPELSRAQAVVVPSSKAPPPAPVMRSTVANAGAPATPAPSVSAPESSIACALHAAASLRHCTDLEEAHRCAHEAEFASKPLSPPAELTVANRSDETLRFYWLNGTGQRVLYATLAPGGRVQQQSHLGAHWLVSTQSDQCLAIFDAATKTISLY